MPGSEIVNGMLPSEGYPCHCLGHTLAGCCCNLAVSTGHDSPRLHPTPVDDCPDCHPFARFPDWPVHAAPGLSCDPQLRGPPVPTAFDHHSKPLRPLLLDELENTCLILGEISGLGEPGADLIGGAL